jgi:hypothetical protein
MSCECPICFENIETNNNCVTTECGHTFHCSCLLQNAAHNGFGCPYCRKELAEELIEEAFVDPYEDEDEEDEEDEEDYLEDEDDELNPDDFRTRFLDNSLSSFRMFHQRLNGEEVEEETEINVELPMPEDYDELIGRGIPNAEFVSRKLLEKGINHQDLVKSLLAENHDIELEGWGIMYRPKSSQVYGQIRAIIHQSKKNYLRNTNQNEETQIRRRREITNTE